MDDDEEFITRITEIKQSYLEIAEREISKSESEALKANEKSDHEWIRLVHGFARALNEQDFGLILEGDQEDFDFITGGGISDPTESTGEFANRAPYIMIDIQRSASLLGFKHTGKALEVWVGPQDWGTYQVLPCNLLDDLPKDYVASVKAYPYPDFFFDEPEAIEYWSGMAIGKGSLHGGYIDLLADGIDLEECEEAWQDVDPDEMIRGISDVGNTMGVVDEECVGGALNLVTSSKRIWFPLANFRGPNDDSTSGVTQRFSILYCKDESGSATGFRAIMTARHG